MDNCSQNELNPPPNTLKVPVWVLLVHLGQLVYVFGKDDETLPNFIKRKHPRKGEKKKQMCKDHTEVSDPLSAETSTNRLFSPLWW